MENKNRKDIHKRNEDIEAVFLELETVLGNAEAKILKEYSEPNLPQLFIVGCARSGSTLLYQYLASLKLFSYPTNFISRFYYAPYLGARMQQMLIDFDRKEEIFTKESNYDFNSKLGKTQGALQPHEFWYFWNRFFKFEETQKMSPEEWNDVDWNCFKRELHAFQDVYKKPLLLKAMNLNWHISDLAKKLPNAIFVHIKRDEIYNAQSLLLSRMEFFGNFEKWYSFKPPSYNSLKNESVFSQVVKQVRVNNNDIINQSKDLSEKNYIMLDYSSFCEDPKNTCQPLFDLLNIDSTKIASIKFQNGNKQKVLDEVFAQLNSICK